MKLTVVHIGDESPTRTTATPNKTAGSARDNVSNYVYDLVSEFGRNIRYSPLYLLLHQVACHVARYCAGDCSKDVASPKSGPNSCHNSM